MTETPLFFCAEPRFFPVETFPQAYCGGRCPNRHRGSQTAVSLAVGVGEFLHFQRRSKPRLTASWSIFLRLTFFSLVNQTAAYRKLYSKYTKFRKCPPLSVCTMRIDINKSMNYCVVQPSPECQDARYHLDTRQ